ncbi:hypothetical protein OH407_23640, partial [Salmonella enterica]|uniref:hypothetical protein n=1 Tax=Salmonella enterica TaxID=28901 RepID=UPI0022B65A1B
MELEDVQTNRERSRVVAKMIIEGRMPEMAGVADQAAVARLRKLLSNPGPELQTIREAIGGGRWNGPYHARALCPEAQTPRTCRKGQSRP